MSPDHITADAYDWNIDKRLAHKLVRLHETTSRHDVKFIHIIDTVSEHEITVGNPGTCRTSCSLSDKYMN